MVLRSGSSSHPTMRGAAWMSCLTALMLGSPGAGAEVTDQQSAALESQGSSDSTVSNGPAPAGMVSEHWSDPVADHMWFGSLLFDQLEYRASNRDNALRWDIVGWYGGDANRLWLKTEGTWESAGAKLGEAEVQGLYGRMIAPFWDVQIGLRYDRVWGDGAARSRGFGVVGLQGLSPYRFEVEPALFVSEDGDLSGRLTLTRDLLLTQRLILQPRFDIDVAAQNNQRFRVGSGLDSIDLGLRARYEIRRELAPYVGVQYARRFGETAVVARADGAGSEDVAFVAGLRIWL